MSAFTVWGLICPFLFLLLMFATGAIVRLLITRHDQVTSSSFTIAAVVLLVMAAMVGLALLAVVGIRSQPIARTPATAVVDAPAMEITPDFAGFTSPSASPPSEWAEVNQSSFVADVYPAMVEASAPLARQTIAAMQSSRILPQAVNSDVKPSQTITLYTNKLGSLASFDTMQRFITELRLQFADASISLQEPAVALSDNQVFGNAIALVLSNQQESQTPSPWDQGSVLQQGELQCEAITSRGRTVASVRYVEKPWVEAFDRFVDERPHQKFLVGYSTSLASSPSDARQEALQDANQKLSRAGFIHLQLLPSVAVDSFVQKLSRPYGDVWRAAYLFDLSSSAVAALATETARPPTAPQANSIRPTVAIGILFALSAVLCVVLNWLTLGYYRNQVGLGWAVVGLVVLSVLIMSS